jgi:hypothetical protein
VLHDRADGAGMNLAPTEVLGPARVDYTPDQPWWLAAPELKNAIEQQPPLPRNSAYYQFGDAVLHIASDTKRLLDMFEQLYGDCAVPPPVPPERPRVRCLARRGGHPPLLLLTFLEGAPHDPASAFLPMRATRVWDSPLPGWRLACGAAAPILAACGAHVLINLQQAWDRLPVEYLVNATLTAQPELVAVHAASLRMNNAGLLLSGPSQSGKTTTSLHLAARGLTLLGDEVALIRLATNEIVPFRRTANLRPGPRERELSAAVERLGGGHEPPVDDEGVTALRIGDLFPGSQARPVSLSASFFLAGFADHPSIAPFRPTLQDLDAYRVLAGNEIATLWGLPLARRALRLMAVRHLLDRLPCWRLTVGAPGETAELIERTMEHL